ncbi:MAG: NAD(P)H-binding protein [Pseudomonadota bacterium]
MKVLLLGATGTIGRATATALHTDGHEVSCLVRPGADARSLSQLELIRGEVTDCATLAGVMSKGGFDAIVSCLASRTGVPADAEAIDRDAHIAVLQAALAHGIARFVLLSAICVQKPKLGFQFAKLAFEALLQTSPLTWSIVRPTAYFKSLSGQVTRVKAGRRFLLFGSGRLTACKPISDRDLGRYLASCLTDPARQNRVLPIGGPGPALTPFDQGEMLFRLLGRTPSYRRVPVELLDGVITGLTLGGHVVPRLRAKAELARIGRYYATESMLVWNTETGTYEADATPSFGTDTLETHYQRLIQGDIADDRGAHAVL